MPRWFVFDIGNVLIKLAYERVLARICASSDLDRDRLVRLMEAAGGYRDLERGLVSFEAFHQALRERGGYRGELEELRSVWSDFFEGPVEGMQELLERVRERYQVAFLSNSNSVHEQVIAEQFGLFFRKDEPLLYSHQLRMAKPDPGIFRHLLERLGSGAGEVIYTDDLLENVRAATDIGIRAYLFEGALELERQLELDGLL